MHQTPILLIPVIFLIFGIFAAKYSISLLLILLFTSILVIYSFLKKQQSFPIQIILSCLFLFTGYFSYIQQQKNIYDFEKITLNKNIDLTGRILEIQKNKNNRFKYCTTIKIERIKISDNWQSCSNKIQIYAEYKHNAKIGDLIFLKNITLKNINNQEFKKFLTKIDISNTYFLKHLNFKLINRPYFCLQRNISQSKKNLIKNIKQKMNKDSFCLFSAIFLGNKNSVKSDMEIINQKFSCWGVLHILARSGLHLWILILIFQLIFIFFGNFLIRRFIILVTLIFFYFISSAAIPFTRSFLTYLLFEYCNIFNLAHNTMHLFLIVCTIILILNPIQIFFLDFQLSFLITYLLLLYAQFSSNTKRILKNKNTIS